MGKSWPCCFLFLPQLTLPAAEEEVLCPEPTAAVGPRCPRSEIPEHPQIWSQQGSSSKRRQHAPCFLCSLFGPSPQQAAHSRSVISSSLLQSRSLRDQEVQGSVGQWQSPSPRSRSYLLWKGACGDGRAGVGCVLRRASARWHRMARDGGARESWRWELLTLVGEHG